MQPAPKITTTDLLKLSGLALVLIDHYGLFFDPLSTITFQFEKPIPKFFFRLKLNYLWLTKTLKYYRI